LRVISRQMVVKVRTIVFILQKREESVLVIATEPNVRLIDVKVT
jgi:hypothetical protein